MPNTTLTPNMNLIVPTVAVDPGPDWATNLNASLSILDSHNHSPGSGVQIQPNGLNINADLPFNMNNATLVRTVRFSPQISPIPNSGVDVGEIYVSGNELYYNDVTGSHQVKITTNGSVNSGAGSITGLPSGTASASFAAGTFTWQAATNTAANMDFASAILRNNTPSSPGLTLSPPTLSGNITETLPLPPPSVTSIMQMDSSGNMSAVLTVDGVTINIVSNQLVAAAPPSAASQSDVNIGTNSTQFVTPFTLNGRTNVVYFTIAGSYTWTAPAGISNIVVYGRGGAGGGGSGTGNGAGGGGAGGGGVVMYPRLIATTPGTQYTIVVGSGGTGGAGQSSGNGFPGANGSASSFSGLPWNNIGLGGAGGTQSSATYSGGAAQFSWAGAGGNTSYLPMTASNGGNSVFASGGSAGAGTTSVNGAGGGGGAGDGAGANGAPATSPGNAGGAGTNGGGGGGSNSFNGGVSSNGGRGSDGVIIIVFENQDTVNVNT